MFVFSFMEWRYLLLWLLQGVLFGAMAFYGILIYENANEPMLMTALPIAILALLLALAVAFWKISTHNGRRIWVYFSIFIFIASGIVSVVIMHFDTPDEIRLASILLVWGAIGFVVSLLGMPVCYAISNRRGGRPRQRLDFLINSEEDDEVE